MINVFICVWERVNVSLKLAGSRISHILTFTLRCIHAFTFKLTKVDTSLPQYVYLSDCIVFDETIIQMICFILKRKRWMGNHVTHYLTKLTNQIFVHRHARK